MASLELARVDLGGLPASDDEDNGHREMARAARRKMEERQLAKLDKRKKAREEKLAEKAVHFTRDGKAIATKNIKNKRLRHTVEEHAEFQKNAAESAARAAILLTEQQGFIEAEDPMERTYKLSQKKLRKMVDLNSAAKQLDLVLEDFSPYRVAWSRNGRHLVMGGRKGHLSVIDALRNRPTCEVQVQETVRDVTFLHNQSMFAAVQKKYVFIYDDNGAEVHRLRSHVQPERLEFLPYHFLLATVGRGGWLKYQDTSTGELVAEHRTKLGPCSVMTQNPTNAIICLGHGNGTVTMWSPSVNKPLVNMFCHGSSVGAIAVSRNGNELITTGRDGKLSIWDVRTYKRLHSYYTTRPPQSIDVSQTGLLAVTCGYRVQIWKDALRTKAQSPYMVHERPGDDIASVAFRPYEDVLGLGHSSGVETILVPGAGLANYDAFEANPFESTRQRRETVVHSLLEKLQPDMITLDPTAIGGVDSAPLAVQKSEREAEHEERVAKEKNRMRGRNRIGKRIKRKHRNIISEAREKQREQNERERKERLENAGEVAKKIEEAAPVFRRFAKRQLSGNF